LRSFLNLSTFWQEVNIKMKLLFYRKGKTGLFIFLGILLCHQFTKGQYFPVYRYTSLEGLPHSDVYRIFQDRKGFLWFGTRYGLSYYDGTSFTNYNTGNGIYPSPILSILEPDAAEKIICHYDGHIVKFSNGNGKDYSDKAINTSGITRAISYGNCVLYVSTTGYLYQINETSNPVKISLPEIQNNPVKVISLLTLDSDKVMIASNQGLFIYKNGVQIKSFLRKAIHEKVYSLNRAPDGSIFIAISGHIIQIKNDKIIKDVPTGIDGEISDFLIDKTGRIWVAFPSTGIFAFYNEKKENLTSRLKLDNIIVNDLFEDREGNIWIATQGSGAFCVRSTSILNYNLQQGIINNYITSITEEKGKIFITSIGTIANYDGNRFEPLHSKYISNTDYIYFAKPVKGKLYIGTPKYLIEKDLLSDKDKIIAENGCISFCNNNDGNALISSYAYLGFLHADKIKEYKGLEGIKGKHFNDIISDNKGNYYFASDSGIVIFNGKYFKRILIGITENSNHTNNLFLDNTQKIWFSCNEGCGFLDKQKITRFTRKNGIAHDRCTAFAQDKSGNIWIGTVGGINKYDGVQFKIFNYHNGLIANEITSLYIDTKQNLWAGTINGLSVISSFDQNLDTQNPPVFITEAEVSDKKFFFPSNITLSPSDKNLQINFAGLSYPDATNVDYRYKIEKLNSNWISTSNKSLDLSSLPPGEFNLVIESRKNGGPWNMNAAKLNIKVIAPFWKTIWFFILTGLIIIITGILFIKIKIAQTDRKHREAAIIQNKMFNLKQQALAALINPHFVFNCLNSIQNYIHKNDKDAASQYLADFATLIRKTLQHAQDSFISLQNELERVKLYIELEQLRFGEKLGYNIIIEADVDMDIQIPNMILQPYIENSIRHGLRPKKDGGLVEIHISKKQTELLISIKDNGVGLSNATQRSNKHVSMGLKLTNERLGLLNKINNQQYKAEVYELTEEKDGTTGTCVELILYAINQPDLIENLNDS
jgi:ligand-binding sensor domain-containing protein/anti-sigma regulatory factor (Ser/Thr protein kinase)